MPRTHEALPAFQKFQYQFTRHIRNPKKNPRPKDVPAIRMGVYNELLFNNFEDVLSSCFPVLKIVLGSRKWQGLTRDFFATHLCHRPFYRQIPDEFMDYLNNERGRRREDPPFLKSLAHYEWIELALYVSDEKTEESRVKSDGDLLQNPVIFNPVLELLSYPFEVHRISPKFRPKKFDTELSHYLVFRNRKDEVEFMTLNAVSARLVDLLLPGKLTGEKALEKIVKELHHPKPKTVMDGGLETLENFRRKGAVLGTKIL